MLNSLHLNFIIYFIALTHSSKFSESEKKVIVDLTKNFATNHLIVINNEPYKNFNLIKYLSKLNMQTGSMTINQTVYYISRFSYIDVNKPHVVMILDLENLDEPLHWLLNYYDEYYLSKYIWIAFNAMRLDFTNVYIPYNCEFLDLQIFDEKTYGVYEIYNMKANTGGFSVLFYGIWNENTGLEVIGDDFYTRRIDLNKTVLEAVIDTEPGDCFNPGMCVYQEIINEMARIMNFRIYYLMDIYYQEMLRNNESFFYEMNVALWVFHIDAFSKDMVAPIWRTPAFLHIAYQSIYEQGATSAHIQPFRPNVWLVIGVWTLISGICILLTKYLIFKYKLKQKFIIIHHLFLSLDSFTNQCGSNIPKIATFRMMVLMTRLAPFLIIPVYSAAVLSFVTVKTTRLPFEDIEGLVKDGTFKIGYENNTFAASFFMHADDPVIETAYNKYVVGLDEMPNNGYMGLIKMCKDPKFAFVFYNNDIYRYADKCRILQIPTSVFVTWDAFMLRFNSPYKTILNKILNTFRSSGVLKYMEKVVYGIRPAKETDTGFISVTLESVLLLFKVTGSAYLICIITFVFEHLYQRPKKKKNHRTRDNFQKINNFKFLK